MSGLDNIIARIADESAAKAKGILDEAQKKADEIILDSAKKTAEECERINKKTDTLVAGTKENAAWKAGHDDRGYRNGQGSFGKPFGCRIRRLYH